MKPEGEEKPNAIVLKDLRGDVRFDENLLTTAEAHGSRRTFPSNPARWRPSLALGRRQERRSAAGARFYVRSAAACARRHRRARRDLASLRANIGIVTQETYLFHDTIAANLRYARDNATDDDDAAAKAANIHDFITRQPWAETIVGERGHKARAASAPGDRPRAAQNVHPDPR